MRISVVVPTLNQGRFIAQCLRSIQAQEYPDLQLIVIDGGSTDDTLDILSAFEPIISRLVSEPDNGHADALAKGFAHADGDIQCFLNSDDLFLPGAFAKVVAQMQTHADVDAVYFDRIQIDAAGTVNGCWRLPPHSDYLMSRWDYIPQETCFWRRSLYERTRGIDASLGFAVDYDLFLQFMQAGRLRHFAGFIAAFRTHPASKTVLENDTLGKHEVAMLQVRYGIRPGIFDRAAGSLLRRYIEYQSRRYLANHADLLAAMVANL